MATPRTDGVYVALLVHKSVLPFPFYHALRFTENTVELAATDLRERRKPLEQAAVHFERWPNMKPERVTYNVSWGRIKFRVMDGDKPAVDYSAKLARAREAITANAKMHSSGRPERRTYTFVPVTFIE